MFGKCLLRRIELLTSTDESKAIEKKLWDLVEQCDNIQWHFGNLAEKVEGTNKQHLEPDDLKRYYKTFRKKSLISADKEIEKLKKMRKELATLLTKV